MSLLPVRVLVVDDYEPFRRLVCSMLETQPAVLVVGEAADGLEAIHQMEELKPDLVLLDVRLPELTGIETAQQILRLAPKSKILFVSQEHSGEVVQEALDVGALGYVLKTMARNELLPALEAVIEGRRFLGSRL